MSRVNQQIISQKGTQVRSATSEEILRWDELIARFKNHRVTHKTAWLRSLENCVKGKMLYLVYENRGEIVGCLPGMITRVGPLRVFGSPFPGWQTVSMGPVFDEYATSTNELIEPLIQYLELEYGVHHIEIMCADLDHSIMERCGFRGRIEYTFSATLFPETPERVLKNMKTNAKRNIKRAQELGLITRFRNDEEFADEVFDQIKEVFHRGGNTVPFAKKRVEEFIRNLKDTGNMIAIAIYLPDGETCIATGLFTVESNELLLWMWTHRTEFRNYRPTEFMTWQVMQKAMELGCDKIDFMGRGDFKAKLGAQLDERKIRWVRSRYQWLTSVRDAAEKIYRWQQSLRGKYIRRSLSSLSHDVSREATI